jgi:hypothetical protein
VSNCIARRYRAATFVRTTADAALFGPIGVIAGFLGPVGSAIVQAARE